jgi:hypothetical protein
MQLGGLPISPDARAFPMMETLFIAVDPASWNLNDSTAGMRVY